jgi:hypothetical protein
MLVVQLFQLVVALFQVVGFLLSEVYQFLVLMLILVREGSFRWGALLLVALLSPWVLLRRVLVRVERREW